MRKRLAIALAVVALLGAATVGGIRLAGHLAETRRRAADETRYVAEAQAALEAYLRGAPGDAGPRDGAPNDTTLDRATALERFGELREITGHGHGHPAWNIQDYHYLDAQRTARFAKATITLKIYVTEGRRTAPGEAAVRVTALHYDHSNGMSAYVAHPELVNPDEPAEPAPR
ncbi:MAG TPA: hypothetical protein VFK43_19260 [Acidimicrobiales bacterium]|nr:hypothetical protein [Acidimicrobiales bacterium]